MYVATLILFVIPWSLIWLGWKTSLKNSAKPNQPSWRSLTLQASLAVGVLAVLTAMGFFLSWTYQGGSPHGGEPKPGLWLALRPIATWSIAATVVLGAFAKGRGRAFAIASAISVIFVIYFTGSSGNGLSEAKPVTKSLDSR
jgi:hypothetical protein